ncbi:rCG37078 [Rattus norvegicus]|uniref:RCG37078 n=1 Tax=Rattus norvegicus TaxID=10116 RepID=A6HUD6_RAT|nr:rCG37078 [Rattus norvegicus]
MSGMTEPMKSSLIQMFLKHAQSRTHGNFQGCGPEPSKYVKILEEPKGYASNY